ncbi:MAG: PAS domain S-box protein [Pyrinomonadaceae bacterium]
MTKKLETSDEVNVGDQSESRLAALFAEMNDIVLVLDRNGRYLTVAPTKTENLYRPPTALTGKTVHDVFSTDTANKFLSPIRAALSEREPQQVEYQLEIEGKEVLFEGMVTPISQDAVLWVARDVTQRRRLSETVSFLASIVESTDDAVFGKSLDGTILSWNAGAERMYGYAANEIIGQNISHLAPPEKQEEVAEILEKLRTGQHIRAFTTERVRKDGRRMMVGLTITPIISPTGEITAASTIARDITEFVNARRALSESEASYRTLFDGNPHPMYVFDRETHAFLAVNNAAIEHYGYTRDEFLNMSVKDIRPVEEVSRLIEKIAEHAETGLVQAGPWKHRKKDGTLIDVQIAVHALTFSNRPANLVLVHDITDKKLLEEQLRQAQKMEAVGRLAGGIAHDFNNLLTAISGYSELTSRVLPAGSKLHKNVDEIKKAAGRAAGLTHQLLAFSRKQILKPVVVDVNHLVRETSTMLQRIVGEDIEFITKLDAEIENISADPIQIQQVLMNLVVNARDAMPKGGKLVIETAPAVLSQGYADKYLSIRSGRYVMLAVSDTGIGMDEETRARIFEPFFTTKEPGKGTGLGLSTVYGTVKQSDGSVWVYSEPGRGTTVKVYLPSVGTQEPKIMAKRDADEELNGNETILLVEDDEVVRKLTREFLTMHGYTVIDSSEHESATTICADHDGPIHLLLTDVVMPGMCGPDLAKILKRIRPKMKVLFMSGYTDEAIMQRGVLDANSELIQKPFSPEGLARKVGQVLAGPDQATRD